jgi:hypothetical protein
MGVVAFERDAASGGHGCEEILEGREARVRGAHADDRESARSTGVGR